MFEAVSIWLPFSVYFEIFLGTVVEFSHISVSKAIDPLEDIVG